MCMCVCVCVCVCVCSQDPPGRCSRQWALPKGGTAVTSLTPAVGAGRGYCRTGTGFSPHKGAYLRSPRCLDDTETHNPSKLIANTPPGTSFQLGHVHQAGQNRKRPGQRITILNRLSYSGGRCASWSWSGPFIPSKDTLKWRCTDERCIRTVHPKLDRPGHQVQDQKPPGKRCSSHQRDSCGSAERHSVCDSQLAAVHLHLKARQCLTERVCQRSLTCVSTDATNSPERAVWSRRTERNLKRFCKKHLDHGNIFG